MLELQANNLHGYARCIVVSVRHIVQTPRKKEW